VSGQARFPARGQILGCQRIELEFWGLEPQFSYSSEFAIHFPARSRFLSRQNRRANFGVFYRKTSPSGASWAAKLDFPACGQILGCQRIELEFWVWEPQFSCSSEFAIHFPARSRCLSRQNRRANFGVFYRKTSLQAPRERPSSISGAWSDPGPSAHWARILGF